MNIGTTVYDNKEKQRFELFVDNDLAILEYENDEPLVYLTHTEVPEVYRRQGVATKLIRMVLEKLIEENRTVVAECKAVKRFVAKNNEFNQVISY